MNRVQGQGQGQGAGGCVYPCGGISCVQSAFARRRCPMQQQPNVTSQLTLITRRLRTAQEGGGEGEVGGADIGEADLCRQCQLIARLLCAAVHPCVCALSLFSLSLCVSFKVAQKMCKVYVFEGARLHVRQITRFNDFGDSKDYNVPPFQCSFVVWQSRRRRRRRCLALFQFVAHCW